jgi:hemerythrin-like domain-containing protein
VSSQIDLYVGIHKGQRVKFFDIARKAGRMAYSDQGSLDQLFDELIAFREHMRLHASLEEKFIHPLLSERVPGGARKLERDHRLMHQQLDDITTQFEGIKTRFAESETRRELVLEFYRAWNRFISFYFTHINEEEENVQPTLWKICINKELADTFKAILASQNPEELKYNLQIMLPAMNIYEQAEIINAGRANIPPQAFQGFLKLAEQVLSPDDWKALKPKIGMQ